MPLYQQSTLPFSSAQSYVAAAGGSEGNPLMEVLAGRAVSAALERYHNFWRWEHYWTVFSGFNGSAGSVVAAIPVNLSAAAAGDSVLQAYPIAASAYTAIAARLPNAPGGYGFVLDINDMMMDMTFNNFSDTSGVITLTTPLPYPVADGTVAVAKQQGLQLPSDVRDIYDVRLFKSGRTLQQMDQRTYDIAKFRNTPGTTTHYGVYGSRSNVSAAINLFPPPAEDDQLMVRYHRRPAMPSAAATVLDIPQDAELAILSLAKAYYLADRGGNDTRGDMWRREGEMALRELRARENQKPDWTTGFRPGYEAWGMRIGPNETWPYLLEG